MTRITRLMRRRAACALVGLSLTGPAFAGDKRESGESCWTPAIVPAPPGYYLHQAFGGQADLAKMERLVVYQEEWVVGTAHPKQCSLDHLETIADWIVQKCMPHSTFPVRIEPSGDPNLDVARRNAMVSLLVARGIGDAEQRVRIYPPSAEGLRWDSIDRLYLRGFFSTIGGAGNQGNTGNVGFGTTGFSGGSTFVPGTGGGTLRSPF